MILYNQQRAVISLALRSGDKNEREKSEDKIR
jgi:hypothetical protein